MMSEGSDCPDRPARAVSYYLKKTLKDSREGTEVLPVPQGELSDMSVSSGRESVMRTLWEVHFSS